MLELKNLIKTALLSLYKNKMRSILTSLGIIIGVSAVIIMVALGEGASLRIQENISAMGTDMLMIYSRRSRTSGVSMGASSGQRLSFDDVEKLENEARYLKAISPIVRTNVQAISDVSNWNTSVYGVSPEYLYIKGYKIGTGKMISERDEKSKRKVAVLGETVAEELFPGQDPVGRKIRIDKTPFIIIGTLEPKGENSMGFDQDDLVLTPSTTALYRLKGGRFIDYIYASAKSSDVMYDAQEEITEIIREAHGVGPDGEDDFHVRNQAEIIDMASSTTQTLTLLLGGIAMVSLIVGGIGIMNIMLVSVIERTREIGIRLSVGARSRDIMMQFLAEAIILSMLGGFAGILLSVGVIKAVSSLTELYVVINSQIIMLSVLFAGIIGVFFGFQPARKAANLNPIDALRHE